MDKIWKTSKIIAKILSVFFWIAVAVTGLATIGTIIMLLSEGRGDEIRIVLGKFEMALIEDYQIGQWKPLFTLRLINIMIAGAFNCFVIRTLRKIFNSMAQGKPFDSSVSPVLKKLSWAVLLFGIISITFAVIIQVAQFKFLDINFKFNANMVTSYIISYARGLFYVMIKFALVYFLSNIFKYGEELQQLSDETL